MKKGASVPGLRVLRRKSFRRASVRAYIYVTRVTLRFLRRRVPEKPPSEQPVANIYEEHRRIDGVSAFMLQQRQILFSLPLTGH